MEKPSNELNEITLNAPESREASPKLPASLRRQNQWTGTTSIGGGPTPGTTVDDTVVVGVAPPTEFDGHALDSLDTRTIALRRFNYNELIRLIRALPGLTSLQTRIIELRYCDLILKYKYRLVYIDTFYHASRGFISLGSVIVPALLSIQSPTAPTSQNLYWFTWIISLLVTILHNFTSIYRFDKKYFGLHSIFERLVSEGWQYLELSGRYSGHFGKNLPTHENQFIYFVNSIERINMKQIQEEYNAPSDAEKQHGPKEGQQAQDSQGAVKQIVPSPMDPTLNRAAAKEKI